MGLQQKLVHYRYNLVDQSAQSLLHNMTSRTLSPRQLRHSDCVRSFLYLARVHKLAPNHINCRAQLLLLLGVQSSSAAERARLW